MATFDITQCTPEQIAQLLAALRTGALKGQEPTDEERQAANLIATTPEALRDLFNTVCSSLNVEQADVIAAITGETPAAEAAPAVEAEATAPAAETPAAETPAAEAAPVVETPPAVEAEATAPAAETPAAEAAPVVETPPAVETAPAAVVAKLPDYKQGANNTAKLQTILHSSGYDISFTGRKGQKVEGEAAIDGSYGKSTKESATRYLADALANPANADMKPRLEAALLDVTRCGNKGVSDETLKTFEELYLKSKEALVAVETPVQETPAAETPAAETPAQEPPAATPKTHPTASLEGKVLDCRRNSKGEHVKTLQTFLKDNGYTSVGAVDGDLGSKTTRATAELQALLTEQGLYKGKIDGVYGPGTHRAIGEAVEQGLPLTYSEEAAKKHAAAIDTAVADARACRAALEAVKPGTGKPSGNGPKGDIIFEPTVVPPGSAADCSNTVARTMPDIPPLYNPGWFGGLNTAAGWRRVGHGSDHEVYQYQYCGILPKGIRAQVVDQVDDETSKVDVPPGKELRSYPMAVGERSTGSETQRISVKQGGLITVEIIRERSGGDGEGGGTPGGGPNGGPNEGGPCGGCGGESPGGGTPGGGPNGGGPNGGGLGGGLGGGGIGGMEGASLDPQHGLPASLKKDDGVIKAA